MGFQADVLDVPVVRPTIAETTCLGAAYAAGLTVGFWPDLDTLRAQWMEDTRWTPNMSASARATGRPPVGESRRPEHELGRRLTAPLTDRRTTLSRGLRSGDHGTTTFRRRKADSYLASPSVTLTVCDAPLRVDRQRHALADGAALHVVEQIVGRVHGLAVEARDHVADLEAGLVRGAAGGHGADQRAGVVVGGRDADAQLRVRDLDALDDVVGDLLGPVGRDREADTDVAVGATVGRDRGVDADDLTVGVDQRATGVARVDRGVGLDRAGDRGGRRRVLRLLALTERVLRRRVGGFVDGAVQRADDAGGDRTVEAERAADREHRVADLQRRAVAERRRRSGR